jgi:TPR repeat protein
MEHDAVKLYGEFKYKEAMELFKSLDTETSTYYIGEMLLCGQGVLKNEETALKFFFKLDKNPLALYKVAYILENQQNFEKSLEYYKLSL